MEQIEVKPRYIDAEENIPSHVSAPATPTVPAVPSNTIGNLMANKWFVLGIITLIILMSAVFYFAFRTTPNTQKPPPRQQTQAAPPAAPPTPPQVPQAQQQTQPAPPAEPTVEELKKMRAQVREIDANLMRDKPVASPTDASQNGSSQADNSLSTVADEEGQYPVAGDTNDDLEAPSDTALTTSVQCTYTLASGKRCALRTQQGDKCSRHRGI